MKLYLLSQDLMLTARTEGVARKLGMRVVTLRDSAAATCGLEDCQLLVVDLGLAGVDLEKTVRQVRQLQTPVPIVACGPHVHEVRLEEARNAGCDLVVSRGQWDRDAEKLCQGLLDGSKKR
ncbi:MAG: hypothetical protein MI725_03755 [Pirellulales bacterium]|nr:hypothetical protein [Pirellulales bacterium]